MIKKIKFINYSINVSDILLDSWGKTKGESRKNSCLGDYIVIKYLTVSSILYFVLKSNIFYRKNEWIGHGEARRDK